MTKPDLHIPRKAEWAPGPWQDEPDRVRFTHAGLECYVYRNDEVTGCLNGYVAVPDMHPWWGKDRNECLAAPQCEPEEPPDFDDWAKHGMPVPTVGSAMRAAMMETKWYCAHTPAAILEAHGGVTYAGPMRFLGDEGADFAWGFGFDTAHAGDLCPLMDATLRMVYLSEPGGEEEWAERERIFKTGPLRDTYRDLAYVRAETERLAEQLALVRQTIRETGER